MLVLPKAPSVVLPGPAATTADHSRVGQTVQDYRIQEIIGAGGMGVVYLAIHQQLGRRAAIKTLAIQPAGKVDAEARLRFLREAQACARLEHPGLVDVFGCGELPDGQPFILMEYLAGETLRTHLRRMKQGLLSVAEAVGLALQIADAMTHAHAHGIVHREQRLNYKSCVSQTDKTAQRRRLTHATHKPDEGIPSDHIDSGIAER